MKESTSEPEMFTEKSRFSSLVVQQLHWERRSSPSLRSLNSSVCRPHPPLPGECWRFIRAIRRYGWWQGKTACQLTHGSGIIIFTSKRAISWNPFVGADELFPSEPRKFWITYSDAITNHI
jgi:hypothetical protein